MHARRWNQVAVASLGIMLLSAPVLAGEEGHGSQSKQHMRKDGSSQGDKKEHRAKMRARMEEQQGKLDELTTRMNQATGNEKVDAMAALLNEMVAQRKALRDRIADRISKAKEDDGYDREGASKAPDKSR
jgi:hypothetical protein